MSFKLRLLVPAQSVRENWEDLEAKDPRMWDFSGSPVVKTLRFHCRGHRFNPWLVNKDLVCYTVLPKINKNIKLKDPRTDVGFEPQQG